MMKEIQRFAAIIAICLSITATSVTSTTNPQIQQQQQQEIVRRQEHNILQAEARRRQLQQRRTASTTSESLGNDDVATRLKRTLLESYDRYSYPWTEQWKQSGNSSDVDGDGGLLRQGVPVELGINFHKVYEVDIAKSTAEFVVWFRERWNDPRLRWDPMEYDNLTSTFMWIGDGTGGGETSQIWTPDLQLWNQDIPLSSSLADAHAIVNPDGTVFWSRPGHLKSVCRFVGLEHFPFDELQCTIEIGSWAYSGLYLRPIKMNGEGYSIGGSETAGESFAEYRIRNVVCEELTYPPFPGAPEEDWPVMLYHVTFERAWEPYARGYFLLQILLNVIAFASFWIPPQLGERMGLAITAMLAAVASELVISSNLPSAPEMTFYSKFTLGSTLFSAAVIFESTVVVYFYHCVANDLVPPFVKWIRRRLSANRLQGKREIPRARRDMASTKRMSTTSAFPNHKTDSKGSYISDPDSIEEREDDASQRSIEIHFEKDSRDIIINEQVIDVDDLCSNDGSNTRHRGHREQQQQQQQQDFERSFAQLRREFQQQARKMESERTLVGKDANDFKTQKEMFNNQRWNRVAHNIDEVARIVFPLIYAIFVGIAFGTARNHIDRS